MVRNGGSSIPSLSHMAKDSALVEVIRFLLSLRYFRFSTYINLFQNVNHMSNFACVYTASRKKVLVLLQKF